MLAGIIPKRLIYEQSIRKSFVLQNRLLSKKKKKKAPVKLSNVCQNMRVGGRYQFASFIMTKTNLVIYYFILWCNLFKVIWFKKTPSYFLTCIFHWNMQWQTWRSVSWFQYPLPLTVKWGIRRRQDERVVSQGKTCKWRRLMLPDIMCHKNAIAYLNFCIFLQIRTLHGVASVEKLTCKVVKWLPERYLGFIWPVTVSLTRLPSKYWVCGNTECNGN